MKKITLVLLAVIFVLSCVGLAACNKGAQEALDSYLLEQDNQVVEADFVLPATIGEYEVEWSSDSEAIKLTDRGEDYLAEISMGDELTEVTLTVSIGKLSKTFVVRVAAFDVYYLADRYIFPQDSATVSADFELDSSFTYEGKTATITWSVLDAYKQYITISSDGKKCIVNTDAASTNPAVRIQATFSYGGKTTTKSYRMTTGVPMSDLEEIDYWYNNTGVSIEIKGYVVAIGEAWTEQYGNMCIYVVDEDFLGGFYVYRVKADKENADKVKPGVHVTITGTTNTNYNGLIETNSGGNLVVDEDIKAIDVRDYIYAYDQDIIGGVPAAIYQQSRLVSLTNWEVKSVATSAPDAGSTGTLFTLTKGGVDVTVAVSKYLAGEYLTQEGDATWEGLCALVGTVKAGDVVSVTGILGNYNGAQIMPLEVSDVVVGGTKDPDGTKYPGKDAKAAIDAVAEALAAEGADKRITAEKTFTLPTDVNGVTVTYELCSNSTAVTLEGGNTFKVVPPENEARVNVKATFTVKDGETVVYETVDFFRISTVVLTADIILDELQTPPTSTEKDFELDANATWEVVEGEEVITIEGNTAKVTRGEEDVRATLKATVEYNGVTVSRNYFVTVIADELADYYVIELTVDSMQLQSGTYQDGTVNVDRVPFTYTELGNYGDGIQMRIKDEAVSTIKNDTAFHAGIAQIVVTLSDTKSVYDNADAFKFEFGTADGTYTETKMFSTVADTNYYVITPDSANYTYFKLSKVIESYSFYFKSIEICFTEPNDITYTDEEKVDAELATLKVDKLTYTEDGTATLPVAGTTHTDVTISWASNNAAVVVDGANLAVTMPSASTRAVLTATVTCGNVSKTKTFPVHMVVDVVDAAYNLLEGETLADMTLTGVIIRVDDAYSEQYKNVTVTIIVDGKMDKLIECFRMTGEQAATIKAGDKITVTGDLTNYKGKIEFNSGCVLTAVTTATADELEYVTLFNLEIPQTVTENFTLPEGATYVVKDGTAIAIDGLNATVTRGEEDATVVITATINGKSLDYTVVVKADDGDEPAPTEQIITIPQTGTFKLVIEQNSRKETLYFTGAMNGYYYATSTNADEAVDVTVAAGSAAGKYTLSFVDADGATQYLYIEKSGTHTNVKFGTTPFDWTWEAERNVLIATLSDGDYYLGTYSNYNTISASDVSRITDASVIGVSQFPARFYGTMAEPTDAQKVAADKAALQLEETYTENFTLPTTGANGSTISWAVTEGTAITVDGAAATVIRGAEDATVTLTATITCGEESDTKAFTVTVPAEGTVVPTPGTEEDPYTVAEALAAANALGEDEYSAAKVYVEGVVSEITRFDSDRSSYTFYIKDADGTDQLTVFSCKTTADITKIYVGDTVKVYGYLQNYRGNTPEVTYKGDENPVFVTLTRGTSAITVAENDNVTVTLSAQSGENGTEFTFTIVVDTPEYVLASVAVNGTTVTAVEGVYTAVIDGPTTLTVSGYVPSTESSIVTVDFKANFGTYGGSWSNSYAEHTITSADLGVDASEATFNVVLSNASKQTGTITDMPVICAKNTAQYVTVSLSSGTIAGVTFNLKEWTAKKKFTTITIEYTTDGATWQPTNVGLVDGTATTVSPDYTTVSAADLAEGVIGVRLVYVGSTSSNTQIGLEGLTLTVK